MQGLQPVESSSHFIGQRNKTFDGPISGRNFYGTLQQDLELGVQALKNESPDMAVTLFQSALQKLTVDQPFYDHLVHNLLLSYKLLIEKLLKVGETSMALDFLRAALRLEIRGKMAEDAMPRSCVDSLVSSNLMQAFGIRPVVLVRNVFDSVMSLFDFYNQGAFQTSYFRADWQALNEETKINLLIENVIPWYFQFVASWDLVEKQKRLEVHWLTYEELVADKPSSILKVLEFYGLGASRRGLEQRIKEVESEERKIRFNKGVAGRGKSGLNDRQKEQMRRFTRFYPSTDFSRKGL